MCFMHQWKTGFAQRYVAPVLSQRVPEIFFKGNVKFLKKAINPKISAVELAMALNDPSHARLGHIGQDRMTRLAREGLLGPLARVNLQICEACLAGKACMKPFGKAVRVTQPLELVHSDICGPMSVKARHGASYFLTLIDDYMRYGYAYLISHCYEALDSFRRFVAEIENQKEKSLKTLCTDRGREYLSDHFKKFCEGKGMRRQLNVVTLACTLGSWMMRSRGACLGKPLDLFGMT
ncbi:hypothetical protein RJ640_019256 [Escallonia rubra]|uniref:Integrase catalytic domain-containing protein n=1 Tax=Escallonia rubra TaxID=112253 RepID=A0AA88RLC6_9ASTE|nr:hypothetical protein RJ640_019256 [Escallonia rubra]